MRKVLAQLLGKLKDDVEDENKCPMTDEQVDMTIDFVRDILRQEHLWSKYQSYTFLNISRAQFDRLVKEGSLPQGKKVAGFKELFWEEKEIRQAANKMKKE